MTSWRSFDGRSNGGRRVRYLLCLLVPVLATRVSCDNAPRPCVQSRPVDVRVATVFSESVVRATVSAVSNDSANDAGLAAARFRVLTVFKGHRSANLTAGLDLTATVPESDLQCVRANSTCLVFVNVSPSIPGTRTDSAGLRRVSWVAPWSRKSLRYVRRHICQSQLCSKQSQLLAALNCLTVECFSVITGVPRGGRLGGSIPH